MRKFLRTATLLFVAVFLILYACYFRLANYGFRQLAGQVHVLTHTKAIAELMEDSAFPDTLKQKFELIQEIKQFTVDSLGLKPSKSYNRFYDQHGKPIIWVVMACPPYCLEPKKWKFPIAGAFSYKGFFDQNLAQKEADELREEGFDVRVGEISAWSTLGYLQDPVLSSMLKKQVGELASLLIHELTHGTIFVKNDLKFNENLADFVGDEGAKLFLEAKFGKQSQEFREYEVWKDLNEAFSEEMVAGADSLNKLFRSFTAEMVSMEKDSLKYEMIEKIMRKAEKLPGTKYHYKGRGTVNNADFTAYLTYRGDQDEFRTELGEKFNGNFKEYLTHLKGKYNSIVR